MGTRGQVKIKDTKVYLYQHYDSYNLEDEVRKALSKKVRWSDPEYLARIIFDDMIGDDHGGFTSYGIGTKEHDDIEYLIEVDCKNKTVTVKEYTVDEEDHLNWIKKSLSFEDFINDSTGSSRTTYM